MMKKVFIISIVWSFFVIMILSVGCKSNGSEKSITTTSYAFYAVNDTSANMVTIKFFASNGQKGVIDSGKLCAKNNSYYESGICGIGTLINASLSPDYKIEDLSFSGVYYFKDGKIYFAGTSTGMQPKVIYVPGKDLLIKGIDFEELNLIKLQTNQGEIIINVLSGNSFVNPDVSPSDEPEADADVYEKAGVIKGYLIVSEKEYFLCDVDFSECKKIAALDNINYDVAMSENYFYYVTNVSGQNILGFYDISTGKNGTLSFDGKPLIAGNYSSGENLGDEMLLKSYYQDNSLSLFVVKGAKVRLIKHLQLGSDKFFGFIGIYKENIIYKIVDISGNKRITRYCMDSYAAPITIDECPQLIYQTSNNREDDGTLFNNVLFVSPFVTYLNIAPGAVTKTTDYDLEIFGLTGAKGKDPIAVIMLTGLYFKGGAFGKFGVVKENGDFYVVDESLHKSPAYSLGITNSEKVTVLLPSIGMKNAAVFMALNIHSNNTMDAYLFGFNGSSTFLLQKAVNVKIKNLNQLPFNPYLGGFIDF